MSLATDLLKKLPLDQLFEFLWDQIFNKKKKPTGPVLKPGGGDIDDDFPDDNIPAPKGVRTIDHVKLKLARIQLNKQRFPEAYEDGKNGLVPNPGSYEDGDAIPYGSKVWLDLTAYDKDGREFLRPDVMSHDLAYNTKHQLGEAFIIGKGADANGNPNPGYETNDAGGVGNGISAWISSKGFLHQMKVHEEGSFLASGSVRGVGSNTFKVNVS